MCRVYVPLKPHICAATSRELLTYCCMMTFFLYHRFF